MAKIILLAGMRGVGKSTLLKTFSERTISIDAEEIQSQAIKIAKGDVNYPHSYEWDEWDHLRDPEIKSCLKQSLSKLYTKPTNPPSSLLVAGALLAKRRFRNSLIDAIKEEFSIDEIDQKFYVIHLNEKTISHQIEKRGRESEKNYIGNYEKIKTERDGYFNICNSEYNSELIKITSHKEIRQELRSLLPALGKTPAN